MPSSVAPYCGNVHTQRKQGKHFDKQYDKQRLLGYARIWFKLVTTMLSRTWHYLLLPRQMAILLDSLTIIVIVVLGLAECFINKSKVFYAIGPQNCVW